MSAQSMDPTPEPQSESVFAQERQHQITAIVNSEGRARVVDLAERFGVSAVTIRKDLLVLESQRRLVRTHGGAIPVERNRPELAFDVRELLHQEEKSRIGEIAARMVVDGEAVALDASTTALHVARQLAERDHWQELTVVTNGIRIAAELASHPGIVVLMPGGRLRPEALSLLGQLGDSMFRKVNIQTAFLGATGFTIETGLSDSMEEEAQMKRSMVAAARRVVTIVDHTKWGRAAVATFCRTERIDAVITDTTAPAEMVDSLARLEIPVHSI